ncbi:MULTISPECIES: glycosyltransferase family 2 protein [unclassified Pseudomonas]|uniref:glycosyltransferase family 2 protein n=1 Tax=unclassified Pseudomonas TaxID=196821 RepID=UPI000BD15076|nr:MULTISPECIES: glycosyltransferase family 2 protein [unclassified Pseudomonas]PVZ11353.1 glycosyltransferase involved in cell wall biosynthesis [Pseudomonas sp. URIL14HWK12:I12]PVZ22351.1 glycosyltransferase involved in cell wall biosynthesis [Pseudomonas sp. URIL14HWK12:I10]PVZ31525.1 glycosyltransferase involved in cell wall biosynthesis [Pseudomonas sp. URIL14HWK12:I11]SNZ16498.1 Glycosyltransferase involved in cell wall bisynthesis [Pseudomonas sp. URIL14HWK12:I9]
MLISLIVPVYNERDAIPLFYEAAVAMSQNQAFDLELVFVDDGSVDDSAAAIQALVAADQRVVLISLSRNFGKEPALLAGLDHCRGDAVIPIDVDLQDPVELVPRLVERWLEGADVVLAKRADRQADGWFKRVTARGFYRVLNRLSKNRFEGDVGDFRLLSRKTVEQIKAMPERNLYMKGLMQWVGGHQAIVEYTRLARAAGISKFNGWKLWNLALEGITSFSTLPLRVWSYIGLAIACSALIFGGWIVLKTLIWGDPVAGYPSLMAALLFLGGVQLIGIGVLGEYIGRIYTETQSRPRYIIDHIAPRRADGAAPREEEA